MSQQSISRYVIIGNGIAGTSAAEALRKANAQCQITLITDEPYPLYNRISLPPYLKKKIPLQKVFLRTVEAHKTKFNIDLMLETRVTAVNPTDKTVLLHTCDELPYDKLLIATGGAPNKFEVLSNCGPCHPESQVGVFQYLDETNWLIERAGKSSSAIVIGASFISYELAEAFASWGLQTTWIQRGPRFLHRFFDESGGQFIDSLASKHNVRMIYNDAPANIECSCDDPQLTVTTQSGASFTADMVTNGIGLSMNTKFLHGSGIALQDGVLTNEYFETSVPDIYAAGDVAMFKDMLTGGHMRTGTWNSATAQGRAAAKNMLGGHEPFVDVVEYSSGMFDSIISVVGDIVNRDPKKLHGVSRLDEESGVYRRLIFEDTKLCAAVMVGSRKGKRQYEEIIKAGEAVATSTAAAEKLLDVVSAEPAA